jgi:predicted Zn-dependent protease
MSLTDRLSTMNEQSYFVPAATGERIPARIVISGTQLNIYLSNAANELLIWNIRSAQSCEYHGNTLFLKRNGDMVESSGIDARAIHQIWVNKDQPVPAEKRRNRAWLIVTLTITALIISAVLFTWFWLLPFIAEKSAALIPKEVEEKIGESTAAFYSSGDTRDSADFYLQKFTDALRLETDYKIKVQVLNSDQINAFAVPGGRIFVYSALIKKMTQYEQLVSLLGHEVTHIKFRHSLKSICRSLAANVMISAIIGDATGISTAILSQADKFTELDYSRELELQADEHGYYILVANKIFPDAYIGLLELLKKEEAGQPAAVKYLSSHPLVDERIENIKNQGVPQVDYREREDLAHLFDHLKRQL